MADSERISTQQLPARLCGRCTVCCVVLRVDALAKAAHTPCRHIGRRGCTHYQHRPEQCRVWHCLWQISQLPDVWRPDKSGVVLDVAETSVEIGPVTLPQHEQVVIAYEAWPAAFAGAAATRLFRHLSEQRLLIVLRPHDGRRLFLGPSDTVTVVREFLRRTATGS
jgi:hypothetical protein